MNKKVLWCGVLVAGLLTGCSQKNESVEVVSTFWKAFVENDISALEAVLKNDGDAEFLASGRITLSNYEVLDEVPGGVEVKFSRFCYADAIAVTKVVDVKGKKKIDFRSTLLAQIQAMKDSKPTEKYCYEFKDKPLSGLINGQKWQSVKTHVADVDWGDKITQRVSIHSEDCDPEVYGKCKLPSLIISNLDLESEGGNFNNIHNLTIYTPPGDNKIISTGSYRISMLDNGAKKVELSFENDKKNYLSGHFVLNNK